MDTIRMQLKTLNRQQGMYSKTKTMMKNNLIALLDQTYPGVNVLNGWTLPKPSGMWTVCGT